MGFFSDSPQPRPSGEEGISAPLPSVAENVGASFDRARHLDLSDSEFRLTRSEWAKIIESMDLAEENQSEVSSYARARQRLLENPGRYLALPFLGQKQYEIAVAKIVQKIKENPEKYPDLQWVSKEAVEDRIRQDVKSSYDNLDYVKDRSFRKRDAVGRFVGETAAIATDPFIAGATVLSMGMGGATTLLRLALREAMIAGGAEAVRLPFVADWYRKNGIRFSAEQAATMVAGAAIGGAAFPMVGEAARVGTREVRGLIKGLTKLAPSEKADDLLRRAEELEAVLEADPLDDMMLHQDRLDEAMEFMEDGEIPPPNEIDAIVRDEPVETIAAVDADPDAPKVNIDLVEMIDQTSKFEQDQIPNIVDVLPEEFDPDSVYKIKAKDLQVDAKMFQFKSGGNDQGVTDRLALTKEWEQFKAGTLIAFQDKTGQLFVADGHQRINLAKKIMANDPTQDIDVYAVVLREADGITATEARAHAAIKNIEEGTGSALDAVKVMDAYPKALDNLPPNTALIRHALNLRNLSPNARQMVINNVIPQHFGAVVGRLIPDDPGLQESVIGVLARTNPANERQAEFIVMQALNSGSEMVEQTNLFGKEMVVETYWEEKSKILDRAVTEIRNDKRVFDAVGRNASELEKEGNRLNPVNNMKRIDQNGQAMEFIKKLAFRAGPVADELNKAAKAVKNQGQTYAGASREFVKSVRGALAKGGPKLLQNSDAGSGPHSADVPTSQAPAESFLDTFDKPDGNGPQQQTDQLQRDILDDTDLDEPIPVTQVVDGEVETTTKREIMKELEQDQKMIDRLKGCAE